MSSDSSDLKEAQTDSVEVSGQKSSLRLAIDFAEWGWSIIANAGGGDWNKESPDWQKAAAQYRDDFHNTIRHLPESEESFHQIMRLLKDAKLPHGRCQPRSDKACTHCNAQDELDTRLTAYKGRPVRAQ